MFYRYQTKKAEANTIITRILLLQDQFVGNRLEQSLAQDIAMGPSDIVRSPQSPVRNRKARGKLFIYSQWRTWLNTLVCSHMS